MIGGVYFGQGYFGQGSPLTAVPVGVPVTPRTQAVGGGATKTSGGNGSTRVNV